MAGCGSVSKFLNSLTAGFVGFYCFVFNPVSSKKNNAEPPPKISSVDAISLISLSAGDKIISPVYSQSIFAYDTNYHYSSFAGVLELKQLVMGWVPGRFMVE